MPWWLDSQDIKYNIMTKVMGIQACSILFFNLVVCWPFFCIFFSFPLISHYFALTLFGINLLFVFIKESKNIVMITKKEDTSIIHLPIVNKFYRNDWISDKKLIKEHLKIHCNGRQIMKNCILKSKY